jgi:hypothetical protein
LALFASAAAATTFLPVKPADAQIFSNSSSNTSGSIGQNSSAPNISTYTTTTGPNNYGPSGSYGVTINSGTQPGGMPTMLPPATQRRTMCPQVISNGQRVFDRYGPVLDMSRCKTVDAPIAAGQGPVRLGAQTGPGYANGTVGVSVSDLMKLFR